MAIKEKWKKLEALLFKKMWFTGLLVVLSSLGIGLIAMSFSSADDRVAMTLSYFQHPWTIALNLLPPVLFALLLWFLTNRAIVAYGGTAVLFFLLSLANWYKLFFRDDPLLFEDLLLWQEAKTMLGSYHLFMTPYLALSIFVLLAGGVVMFFCARGRFARKWPRFALAGAVLLAVLPVSRLYYSSNIYMDMASASTDDPDHTRRWSTTEAYTTRGFVYSFFRSGFSAFETTPEGYDKKEVQALLAQYEDKGIPEGQQVDIIGIMLEAFSDFSKYSQIPFAQDPYEKYHALEAESFTGDLATNIFAGGTVNTERTFLTGMRDPGSLRGKTNSYAWYLRSQEYEATGSHPCYGWIYNRQNINPNMGLDPYYFQENRYDLVDWEFVQDDILLPGITELYLQQVQETGAPQFSFSVTYQGHGPYDTEQNKWGEDFVQPGAYSQVTENIANNYFGSVHSTSECLWDFVDSYRDLDRPVLIVVFGDHNPWMGNNNTAYDEMGIDLDQDTQEGFMNYYGTRYLVWANDAAKEALGNAFTGEGPTLSPCFLMNQIFEMCGWQGSAYTQYTTQLMKEYPVIHSTGAVFDADGTLHLDPDEDAAEKIRQFQQVEYYMRHEFLYG